MFLEKDLRSYEEMCPLCDPCVNNMHNTNKPTNRHRIAEKQGRYEQMPKPSDQRSQTRLLFGGWFLFINRGRNITLVKNMDHTKVVAVNIPPFRFIGVFAKYVLSLWVENVFMAQ